MVVKLRCRCSKSVQNRAGEVLNVRVDCHPVVQFRIERNLVSQVSLECGPVIEPEIAAFVWVVKGRATRSLNENREVFLA